MYRSSTASGLDNKGGNVRYLFKKELASVGTFVSSRFPDRLEKKITLVGRSRDEIVEFCCLVIRPSISFRVVEDFISKIGWIFLAISLMGLTFIDGFNALESAQLFCY